MFININTFFIQLKIKSKKLEVKMIRTDNSVKNNHGVITTVNGNYSQQTPTLQDVIINL